MNRQTFISDYIENHREAFIQLSDKIWEVPEICFEEYQSADYLCAGIRKRRISG